MKFQALRGTTDYLPEQVTRWSAVEHTAKRLARLYGYRELRTPLIEDAALFFRSIGETTDIVQKEMFRFTDRGGHDIVLRPEGTAAVVRAYLEHGLHKTQGFSKLFYMGPMFRAERPQAGRFRQFHQYGVEAIGSASPWVDVEVIRLCTHILEECGVAGAIVWLASMGCRDDQRRSAEALRKRLEPHKATLCAECRDRMKKNVFRVLDCKRSACHDVAWKGQGSPFLLCAECRAHFDDVRRGLADAKVAFDDTHVFARGLDYYTRTVFEVRAKGLGAKDTVAAGGRYDHLVEELGGPSVGAIGFAAGMERVLMATDHSKKTDPAAAPARRGVYLAVAQPALLREGLRLVQQLREHRVCAMIDYDGKSLKAQLREADKTACQYVVVLGEAELKSRSVILKDLERRTEKRLPLDTFVDDTRNMIGSTCQ